MRETAWELFFFSAFHFFMWPVAGSKQRRQRGSYIPACANHDQILGSNQPLRVHRGLPHCTQIASSLVISSETSRSRGMGSNGRPRKSVSSPVTITRLPASAMRTHNINEPLRPGIGLHLFPPLPSAPALSLKLRRRCARSRKATRIPNGRTISECE